MRLQTGVLPNLPLQLQLWSQVAPAPGGGGVQGAGQAVNASMHPVFNSAGSCFGMQGQMQQQQGAQPQHAAGTAAGNVSAGAQHQQQGHGSMQQRTGSGSAAPPAAPTATGALAGGRGPSCSSPFAEMAVERSGSLASMHGVPPGGAAADPMAQHQHSSVGDLAGGGRGVADDDDHMSDISMHLMSMSLLEGGPTPSSAAAAGLLEGVDSGALWQQFNSQGGMHEGFWSPRRPSAAAAVGGGHRGGGGASGDATPHMSARGMLSLDIADILNSPPPSRMASGGGGGRRGGLVSMPFSPYWQPTPLRQAAAAHNSNSSLGFGIGGGGGVGLGAGSEIGGLGGSSAAATRAFGDGKSTSDHVLGLLEGLPCASPSSFPAQQQQQQYLPLAMLPPSGGGGGSTSAAAAGAGGGGAAAAVGGDSSSQDAAAGGPGRVRFTLPAAGGARGGAGGFSSQGGGGAAAAAAAAMMEEEGVVDDDAVGMSTGGVLSSGGNLISMQVMSQQEDGCGVAAAAPWLEHGQGVGW